MPPGPEIPAPAATIVGPGTRPDRIASRRAVTLCIRSEIANGREPGLQRAAHVVHANQQIVLDVAVDHLQPRPHLVVVAEDVHVRVDEAGRHELLLQVDQPRAGAAMRPRGWVDLVVPDDDGGRAARRLAGTIQQRSGADEIRRSGLRLSAQRGGVRLLADPPQRQRDGDARDYFAHQ